MAKPRKGGLGKGLDALFMDNENADSGTVTLRLSDIEPNENQPRKHFDERALLELADSIKEHGVLQPLLVRQMDSGVYQLVAGERRWRASRIAGLTEVPVVIHDLTDSQVMEIALIENLQREDLNPIEEARGYKNLIDTYDLTQEQVAKKVGKSRPVVANALRLLSLPGEILPMVEAGDISAGHA
ncbi:MAG: ParB/RepB/Spo0J family partition protein, partial [Oscillospiraceae bacterium]